MYHCRGKFDCGFYSDCLQVTNKQTTADIPYSSIQHVLVSSACSSSHTSKSLQQSLCPVVHVMNPTCHVSTHLSASFHLLAQRYCFASYVLHVQQAVVLLHTPEAAETPAMCIPADH
jgi:hypothetical protein